MMRRRKLAAPLIAGTLVLAACGSDDGNDAADEPAAATATDEEMSEEEMAEDEMDEMDEMSDDEMSEDDMSEDEMSEDEMSEDDMSEDEMSEDDMSEDDMMAEGDPVPVTITIENIGAFPVTSSGAFTTPVSGDEPGPALPGDAYEFEFRANAGDRLTFATMFVQSNDWFFAPDPAAGIELFDADGAPISGDVTDQILVWDGGTEIDQEPGVGEDQAPRQAGPDTGADDPDNTVRQIDRNAADYVSVTVTPGDAGLFTVRVDNVSETASVPTPLAPGVYAAHTADVSLFTEGVADLGYGLEALAEDGDAGPLADFVAGITGISGPLAPGAFVVHDPTVRLFNLGEADAGLGLEAIAEDGDPSGLVAALDGVDGVIAVDAFANPDGGEAGPAFPGSTYTFTTEVAHGQLLSFATMLVQSNDWVVSTPAAGLSLVDADGNVIEGDITAELLVVDSGTEVDQPFGFGADQAPRQAGPDTGADDPDTSVRIVEDRDASRYVRVTVSAG